MERKFKIGDRVCICARDLTYDGVNLYGKNGTIVDTTEYKTYPSVLRPYRVNLLGIVNRNSSDGNFVFDERTLIPHIENVIFNNPATIVFWSDGSKTIVKCAGDEAFDEEKGLAMAISKKVLGNKGNYCNEFKKWLPTIEVWEDKGTSMVEVCKKAHDAVESFNKAMKGDK